MFNECLLQIPIVERQEYGCILAQFAMTITTNKFLTQSYFVILGRIIIYFIIKDLGILFTGTGTLKLNMEMICTQFRLLSPLHHHHYKHHHRQQYLWIQVFSWWFCWHFRIIHPIVRFGRTIFEIMNKLWREMERIVCNVKCEVQEMICRIIHNTHDHIHIYLMPFNSHLYCFHQNIVNDKT